MRFMLNANRKWIALALFNSMYLGTIAQVGTQYLQESRVDGGGGQWQSPNTKPNVERYNFGVLPLGEDQLVREEEKENPKREEENNKKPRKEKQMGKAQNLPGSAAKDGEDDTNGPNQPEMASFKPSDANNMVDLFSGDFSYNVPLMDVGGYPINIFYNSNITMDQDASWVGLGWNINPGTVTRNMRGLPDDFDGDEVEKEMKLMDDWTAGASVKVDFEKMGQPTQTKFGTPDFALGYGFGAFYNSYKGVGISAGLSPTVSMSKLNQTDLTKGDAGKKTAETTTLSAGVSFDFNSQTEATISPYVSFKKSETKDGNTVNAGNARLGLNYGSRQGLKNIQLTGEFKTGLTMNDQWKKSNGRVNIMAPITSTLSFARQSYTPTMRTPMNSFAANLSLSFGAQKLGFYKHTTIQGFYMSTGVGQTKTKNKAYGYMHYQKGMPNREALMDFNRVNDIPYETTNPVQSFPVYTYDVFAISGEGTGGSFRAYRGEIGYMKDQYMRSTDGNFNLGVKLGTGSALKFDVDYNAVFTPTEVGEWGGDGGNMAADILKFQANTGVTESVYFRNPGEQSIADKAFFDNMGGDKLSRFELNTEFLGGGLLLKRLSNFDPVDKKYLNSQDLNPGNVSKSVRDKRTQVISYLTAQEAAIAGLNKYIEYYPINVFPKGDYDCNKLFENRNNPGKRLKPCGGKTLAYNDFDEIENREIIPNIDVKKQHHISEITVLGSDGRRYVYGTPAYNYSQEEYSFSVKTNTAFNAVLNDDKNSVGYTATDMSSNNAKGKDEFYQKEVMPAYAHSFLLNGLLSPDYIDLTGNGITDDDKGNAIKFNYSKAYNKVNWRAPFTQQANVASYSSGLVTDNSDDRASVVYGTKEIYYLNSIESKTMIAIFELELDQETVNSTVAKFSHHALGRNGGVDFDGKPNFRLKCIKLYSKPDYISNPNAKPIKTVHFQYSHRLCPGAPSSSNASLGKLTLEKIWFSYNGNIRTANSQNNAYVFNYKGATTAYERNANDRWGYYKKQQFSLTGVTENPAAEFPYTSQAGINATAAYVEEDEVAPWSLNSIKLPSGGKIDITYEKDDYGFVQNKRAMNMMKIKAIGQQAILPSLPNRNQLYGLSDPAIPGQLSKKDNQYIFIEGPVDLKGKQDIAAYYLPDGLRRQLFMKLYVHVPSDQYGAGFEAIPLFVDVEDFGTAGTSANPSKEFWIKTGAHATGVSQMMEAIVQFAKDNLPSKVYPGSNTKGGNPIGAFLAIASEIGRMIASFDRSIRTSNYFRLVDLNLSYVRLGNPHIKKKGGGYRVKEVKISDEWDLMTNQPKAIYGQTYDYTTTTVLSNGESKVISSGVASYEPMIGAEENPWREALRSMLDNTWAPDQYKNQEMPVGETYFPSASVGYSKVRVSSINKGNVKNGTGFAETVFYTTKDFPTISTFTPMDDKAKYVVDPDPVSRTMSFYQMDLTQITQGLLVSLNDMNGKVKSQATFAENNPTTPLTFTENKYRMNTVGSNQMSLNSNVMAMKADGQIIDNALVGKDLEVMADFRQHVSKTFSVSGVSDLNLDLLSYWIPIPVLKFLKPNFFTERTFRSASLVKIVTTYGILERVDVIDNGSTVTTENLLYDAETGDAILNKTQNMFNDHIYNFSYPAHWVYKEMSGAYKNIGTVLNNVDIVDGVITTGVINPQDHFFAGDEVMVVRSKNSTGDFIASPGCSELQGDFVWRPFTYAPVLWVIDPKKDPANKAKTDNTLFFVDRKGNPYSGTGLTLKIIRSGFRNLLSTSVGSVVTKKDPIQLVSGVKTVVFDPNSQALNAGAQQFKEIWKTDPLFRERIETNKIYAQPVITNHVLRPTASKTAIIRNPVRSIGATQEYTLSPCIAGNTNIVEGNDATDGNSGYGVLNRSFSAANYLINQNGTKYYKEERTKMDFNYSVLDGLTIVDAKLNLAILGNGALEGPIENGRNPSLGTCGTLPKYGNCFTSGNYHPFFGLSIGELESHPANLGGASCTFFEQGSLRKYISTYGNRHLLIGVTDMLTNIMQRRSQNVNSLVTFKIDIDSRPTNVSSVPVVNGLNCASPNFTNAYAGVNYSVCPSTASPTDYTLAPGVPYRPSNDAFTYLYVTTIGCPAGFSGVNENGNNTCVKYETTKICEPITDAGFINPYVRGILGNWMPYRSMVFYGDRKESKVTDAADLRTAGTINNFKPYWKFVNNQLVPDPTVKEWTWNSEITRFNHLGAELENKDPLNRYNSGIFGYGEKLPVAVANNARYHEIYYDGFEDYNFRTQEKEICRKPKTLTIQNVNSYLDNTESHSGLYSLRLNFGQQLTVKGAVRKEEADKNYGIKINYDRTVRPGSFVGSGVGMTGSYYKNWNRPYDCSTEPSPSLCPILISAGNDYPAVNYDAPDQDLPRSEANVVEWEGFIQPQFSGTYKFKVKTNWKDAVIQTQFSCQLHGSYIGSMSGTIGNLDGGEDTYRTLELQRGKLYYVVISAKLKRNITSSYYSCPLISNDPNCQNGETTPFRAIFPHQFKFSWAKIQRVNGQVFENYHDIPMTQLYPKAHLNPCNQNNMTGSAVCTQLNTILPQGDYLNDNYAMIGGRKMILGFWLKRAAGMNAAGNYDNVPVTIGFNNTNVSTTAVAKSSVIDGWQRFEAEFDAGNSQTTEFTITLTNNGAGNAYIDDIRIHPFKSNLKSFVYHPINLRLMAELDENNYAGFYEYDDEGTLVRVKKETSLGIKTINETRTGMQKIN
jgi:hypothetical protein